MGSRKSAKQDYLQEQTEQTEKMRFIRAVVSVASGTSCKIVWLGEAALKATALDP
ncbi:MAG: hypothetical protein Q7S40_05525 [Opitutaceae bacterium]|nr:hypothetical protein [Opitutaceae bacterium]